MSDSTASPTGPQSATPTQRAMGLIFDFVDQYEAEGHDMSAERTFWQEIGALFEVMTPFDELDDNDLRHTIAAVFTDSSQGPQRFAWRLQQVLSPESEGVLHNPAAVARSIATVGSLFYASTAEGVAGQ